MLLLSLSSKQIYDLQLQQQLLLGSFLGYCLLPTATATADLESRVRVERAFLVTWYWYQYQYVLALVLVSALSFPFLSFPFFSFPFLSFPFLSFPFLSVLVLVLVSAYKLTSTSSTYQQQQLVIVGCISISSLYKCVSVSVYTVVCSLTANCSSLCERSFRRL